MMKFLVTTLLSLLMCQLAIAQKKTINHKAYDKWSSVASYNTSKSGAYILYKKTVLRGNDTAYVYNTNLEKNQLVIPRAQRIEIDETEQILVTRIEPDYDSIRKLKLKDVSKKKYPKDTLKIFFLNKDSVITVAPFESYEANPKTPWVAYKTKEKCKCDEGKKKKKRKKKKGEISFDTDGKWLKLMNPITGQHKIFEGVKDYKFSKDGSYFAFMTHCKHEKDSVYLHMVQLEDLSIKRMYAGIGEIEDLEFDIKDRYFTFLASEDTSEVKAYSMYYYKIGTDSSKMIVDSLHPNMPKNWNIDNGYGPRFTYNGKKIIFGISFFEDEEPEDTLLESEKAEVDIWHYKDDRIQPRQLDQKMRDEVRTFMAMYDLLKGDFTVIEDSSLFDVKLLDHGNSKFALGYDPLPYYKYRSYEFPWAADYYLVNTETGKRSLIKDSVSHNSSIDPTGKYFTYYNALDTNWYVINTQTKKESCLTCTVQEDFASDVNGSPYMPYAEGDEGWTKDGRFIVNARRDLWALDPSFERIPYCLTRNKGEEENIKFSWTHFELDSSYLQIDESLIIGVNDSTKETSFYKIFNQDNFALEKLYSGDFKLNTLKKVKDHSKYLFRTSTTHKYPDIEFTDDAFSTTTQVSDVNPQQKEYNWANVKQVYWKAYDGKQLRGLLFTPENLDTTKKYPMLVYFYERNTDMLHYYYSPKPTASIIYPTEYASSGYVVFIPDVEYEIGHPAKSAYNCIVSGSEAMAEQFPFIDTTKMGLQGQSWGGYQTAQLVTMTDKYAAAMAGAPVSNMFSAYGGIRWGSGLSRQFQYERTQSRIGATIWEKPELYMENSPIFHLPNVTTPLLIMHNDDDGAVPWYQGIEMYMGLRRLDKPVWMLNYNDDQHNLTKTPNKRDLSIRMKQFFDHFLKGEPMPEWLEKGVPAVKKQKEYGLEWD